MPSTDTRAPEPRPPAVRAATRRSRRALWVTAVIAGLLHTLAVLWIWRTWGLGVRGWWLVYMDFPASLLFLDARHGTLLAFSLVLGGLQWALVGALLSKLVASLTRSR